MEMNLATSVFQVHSGKLTWRAGKWTRIENVFPLESGDIPASYVRLPRVSFCSSNKNCLVALGEKGFPPKAFNLQDFANEIRQNLSSLEIGEEIRQIRNRFFEKLRQLSGEI